MATNRVFLLLKHHGLQTLSAVAIHPLHGGPGTAAATATTAAATPSTPFHGVLALPLPLPLLLQLLLVHLQLLQLL